MPTPSTYILSLACPNQPGIVAAVSALLFEHGGDIREAQQFDDTESNRFFARTVFTLDAGTMGSVTAKLTALAQRLTMIWRVQDVAKPRRVVLMASKFDHCLVDLLYRWRIGELPMIPTAIISNHAFENYAAVDLGGIPFHYLPVTPETRADQEQKIRAILQQTEAELVVLARYMQVLSPTLSAELAGRCINIHHSFLPGFKGAKPYHQAHARGVKLIGATAHYVTANLDEGPIIDQDVERISHGDTPDDLIRCGRDIERRVLARAVRYHLEDRVILNGHKTVVFSR